MMDPASCRVKALAFRTGERADLRDGRHAEPQPARRGSATAVPGQTMRPPEGRPPG